MTDKTMDILKIGVDIYASEITLTITADEAGEILSALSESAENKGEWIKMGEAYVCSRCSTTCACTETADKLIWHIDDKFCRGCGASMRGE